MENRLTKICAIGATGMTCLLTYNIALADPSREFNPKLEFTYFEPNDNNTEGSLGIKYELDYGIQLGNPEDQETNQPGVISARNNFYKINLFSKGNLPFKSDFQIGDFTETGIDLAWETVRVDVLTEPCRTDYCDERTPDNSFVFKLAGSYQFEADSEFDNKQHAYGLKMRAAYKIPARSQLQLVNPLEWLPSVIRLMVGDGFAVGDNKRVTASAPLSNPWLPSVGLAVEQIDPDKDDKRAAADPQLDTYDRLRLDLIYSSTLFEVGDQIYRASYTWRYFREIGASEAIKAAGLERHRYSTIAIHTPQNIVISYSSGKLPFDLKSDDMFELGWRFNF